jgi:hypothetical protein
MFSKRKNKDLAERIVVVSGLPRSGTSMMMKMLEAGGIPVLTDYEREADEDNPKGYFEFERVKNLKDGDDAWLPQAKGKVVKVIAALLTDLPSSYEYEVIFMRRAMPEILASQRQMLIRRGEMQTLLPYLKNTWRKSSVGRKNRKMFALWKWTTMQH